MKYLLDTNTISYLMKGTSPSLARAIAALSFKDTFTSVIVEAELLTGLERRGSTPRLAAQVSRVLSGVTILPWTSKVARTYARLRSDLESTGRTIAGLDLLIAAHALSENCTLLTSDAALLRLTDKLSVEDWT